SGRERGRSAGGRATGHRVQSEVSSVACGGVNDNCHRTITRARKIRRVKCLLPATRSANILAPGLSPSAAKTAGDGRVGVLDEPARGGAATWSAHGGSERAHLGPIMAAIPQDRWP